MARHVWMQMITHEAVAGNAPCRVSIENGIQVYQRDTAIFSHTAYNGIDLLRGPESQTIQFFGLNKVIFCGLKVS